MNSLPSLPRLTAEAKAVEIWPKLGSNIGTNIYLGCGIPASPLVVLIAAAGRRNEWRRFEAEREGAETMQRWHSCLPSTPAPPPAPPRRRNDQEPTSNHMGWLLTAQGDDGSGSRPVTHGNDGGSQRFTPQESSSSYPSVTCSRPPPPGFCPLLTSGTPLPPFYISPSVTFSTQRSFLFQFCQPPLLPPSSTAMHSEANLS